MAVFTCPQCGHSQAVDDKHVGKNATCPKCKTQAVVQQAALIAEVSPTADESHRSRTHGNSEFLDRCHLCGHDMASNAPACPNCFARSDPAARAKRREEELRSFEAACRVLASDEKRIAAALAFKQNVLKVFLQVLIGFWVLVGVFSCLRVSP